MNPFYLGVNIFISKNMLLRTMFLCSLLKIAFLCGHPISGFQAICGAKTLSVRLAPEIKPLTSHFADQHSVNLSKHKEHVYS